MYTTPKLPNRYLCFDTEFTQLKKDTTLISVGISDTESMEKFYAECTDYDRRSIDEWIEKNVIANLGNPVADDCPYDMHVTYVTGTRREVMYSLLAWLSKISKIGNPFNHFQFVSDVCHYDFVLLVDLLTNGGTAMELQSNIVPYCIDLNYAISFYKNITHEEAFNYSREQLLNEFGDPIDAYIRMNKHNALYDAEVIKALFMHMLNCI